MHTGLGLVHRRSYAGGKAISQNRGSSGPAQLFSLNSCPLTCPSEENILPGLFSTLCMLRDGVLQFAKMELYDQKLHLDQGSLLFSQVTSEDIISLLGVCAKASR